MIFYFIANILFITFCYSIDYNQEDLKQAKVTEFISSKTISYIEDLKNSGDDKYYHFHKQLDAYFERAKARIILNNIVDAHSDLDEILLRDPEYWLAYYYKGKLFIQISDYSSALPYLEIAADNEDNIDDLILLRGIARFEENVKDRGVGDFEKLLNSDTLDESQKFLALFYYSKNAFNSGELDQSLRSADDAYSINSKNIDLLIHRGNLYRLYNMPDLAIKDLNKALSLGYDNRDIYLFRGMSYIQKNQHALAELDLEKYLSLSEESDLNRPQALLEFAIVKFYLDDKNEALVNFNKVIELIPLETSSFAYRGIIYYQSSAYQEAIDDFNIGIKSGVFGNEIYLFRGNSKFYLGNYEEALKDFNTYLSRNPKNKDNLYDVYINRSIIFYTLGYYEDALKDISHSLEIKSDDSEAYVHRANIYRYLDKMDASMRDLNKALDLGSKHIDIYLSRGLIQFYKQNYDLAEEDLNVFLNSNSGIHKDKNEALLKRGISRYNLNKFDLALKDFNELLFRDPSITQAYRYRSEIYLIKGKKILAKRDLNQALFSDETIPEIYLLRGIVELSLNNFKIAIADFNQFINLTSKGHPDYFHAFHERGIAEFFDDNLVNACIDWNYAAENGYSKSISLINKNCNLYSKKEID